MNTTKIAATITLVAMVTNFSASTTSVLAHELTNKDEITSKIIQSTESNLQSNQETSSKAKLISNSLKAEIKKFEKTNGKFEDAYNEAFKVKNE